MEELEKTARELILAIIEKTLKTLKNKGILKEPSKLQMLCSSPEMTSLIKKLSTPKYDPNRKFRKGDRVKPRERNGRIPWAKDIMLTVVADESTAGVTVRCDDTGEERLMCVLFLELVTPVEELEPYRVETGGYNKFRIKKGNLEYSYFPFGEHCVLSMDEAKAAAEAERDRLNAEWRRTLTETKTPFDN